MKLKKTAVLLLAALTLLPLGNADAAKSAEKEADTAAIPIIMYHHMSKKPRLCGTYTISPETFESDLRWLSEHGYETVAVQDVVEFVSGNGSLPEKPVIISFDDAQESFFVYALPLLEKYGMCAVLAVIGSCAEQFSDYPDHMLDYSYMDWAQIKSAQESGRVEIASHTYDLHSLYPRKGCRINSGEDCRNYRAMLKADLEKLNAALARAGISEPTVFVYPFGSVCAQAEETLRELGFTAALTCDGRINRISRGDACALFKLGRFNRPGKADTGSFFKKTLGES